MPYIKVGLENTATHGCGPTSGIYKVARYPWTFYILHVATAELIHNWPQAVVRANLAAESGYAWYFRQHPEGGSSYDINNSATNQCFHPNAKVPTAWNGWEGVPESHRIVKADGTIDETSFQSGPDYTENYNKCNGEFPKHGNDLAQWGSYYLYKNCSGYSEWDSIDAYYYGANSVKSGAPPPQPSTSYSRPSGQVTLNFPSIVDGYPEGWRYYVDYEPPNDPKASWTQLKYEAWDAGAQTIPTTFTYTTADCYSYRVHAWNPAGYSEYAYFGGNPICPGS